MGRSYECPPPDRAPPRLRVAKLSPARCDPARSRRTIGAVAPPRVLVIDDDPTMCEVVTRYLEREGFDVAHATDGHSGLRDALAMLPDLVVLDLMLPGIDGVEVFRRLREVAPIPVVMLTARGDEEDRVAGLELGADDYVAKPFSPRELTARVRAVLRRASGGITAADAVTLRAGTLEIDVRAHEAKREGRQLALTAKEFDLLVHMMRHPNRAFRRTELLEAVWGYSYGDTATVTVHMRRLREKVETDPSCPAHLQTVQGVGYRFCA
jgi:DNA-binding response OmpR family regulator